MNTRLAAAALFFALAATNVGCAANASEEENAPSASSEDELAKRRFSSLKKASNADLAALQSAGAAYDSSYLGVYRFNKGGPETRDAAARENRIKETMHRYMCTFFDEEISIGRSTGSIPARVKATLNDLDIETWGEDNGQLKTFSDALARVLANPDLDVLSGGASGNNTAGYVMGVYDIAHHEILFFGFTNCGSDN